MSTTHYGRYLSLQLHHSYPANGRCEDWEILPSPQTAALINGLRWGWKSAPDGGFLFGAVEAQEFLQTPENDADLVWHIRLKNPAFMQVTDQAMCPGEQVLLFTNHAGSDDLHQGAPERAWLRGTSFQHRVPAGVADGTVVSLSQGVTAVGSTTVGSGCVQFQLPVSAYGRHTLKYAGAVAADETFWIEAASPMRGIQGIIHLHLSEALPLKGRSFHIRFEAKAAPWTYFLALGTVRATDTVEIVDEEEGIPFSDITGQLGNEPAAAARLAALAQQWPNARIVVMRAQQPMAWQESPRPGLKLVINQETGEPLLKNLPAPRTDDFVIVSIGRPLMQPTEIASNITS